MLRWCICWTPGWVAIQRPGGGVVSIGNDNADGCFCLQHLFTTPHKSLDIEHECHSAHITDPYQHSAVWEAVVIFTLLYSPHNFSYPIFDLLAAHRDLIMLCLVAEITQATILPVDSEHSYNGIHPKCSCRRWPELQLASTLFVRTKGKAAM